MKYSVVISEKTNSTLCNHLIRKDKQEDLCFAFYLPSNGKTRMSAIIKEVLLPKRGDRNVHGNVSFNPQYFDKVTQYALKYGYGICLLHSHPIKGWQSMSRDDIKTEKMLASRVKAVTNLPLLGMTVGTDGTWSGRFWVKTGFKRYSRYWCESIRVIGKKFRIYFDNKQLPSPKKSEAFLRTISSWGEEKQADIMRLKVGIVGLGSVGSIISESLMRMGITNLTLIDFDRLETKNLDRQLSANKKDIGKMKVKVYEKLLINNKITDNLLINTVPFSIVEEQGLLSAIDCDILFSCVDRPWARYVLNTISYANLIPVIDGGIEASFSKKRNNLEQARWRTSTIGVDRRCMCCSKQYTPEDVAQEMAGDFDDPSYIQGLPAEHFINRGENVFAFSLGLAGLEIQQFLSLIIQPKGVYYGMKEMDFVTGNIDFDFKYHCDNHCYTNDILATGDLANKELISKHEVAEKVRSLVKDKVIIKKKTIQSRIKYFIKRLLQGTQF